MAFPQATLSSPDTTKPSFDVEIHEEDRNDNHKVRLIRDLRFRLVILAICITLFLSALDYTAVPNALPTIVHDLRGGDFVWVSSAYALAATALLPTSGAMAQVFGRRFAILTSIGLFSLGSVLCGTAKNMNWLIAARTVQGAGGGAIRSVTAIIISDLVSLHERAMYNAFVGLTWAVASAVGPVVGGAFAQSGNWRWLFYLNLPISGIAAGLVVFCLRLKTPRGSLQSKLKRLDWIGNAIIVASWSSVVIALTWGGVRFAWDSANVLVPLLLGLAGLCLALIYEAKWAVEPLIPFTLVSNRTSLSGYLQTFIARLIFVATTYFIPVYYQACKDSSPVLSGVYILALAGSAGASLILASISVKVTKRYRVQLWSAWACCIIACGALSTIRADSPLSLSIGLPVLMGVGAGMVSSVTYFPVLAPLHVSQNAHALAFFAFCRSFANVWSFSIGTAILQTQLVRRLPADYVAQFPSGVSIAYTIIPTIVDLDEPLRSMVRVAFADTLQVVWQVLVGISGLGLLTSLFMKGLPLHSDVDEQWGLEDEKRSQGSADDVPLSRLPGE